MARNTPQSPAESPKEPREAGWDRLRPETIERFMRKVKQTESGCWFWLGSFRDGRGAFTVQGGPQMRMLAHRVAWEIAHGHRPPYRREVIQVCGVWDCVRPEHQELIENATRAKARRTAIMGQVLRRGQ